MAEVNETKKAFSSSLQEGYIRFYVMPGEAPLAQRIKFEKPDLRERSDGLELQYPSQPLDLNDELSTFSAGDAAALRGLLLKCWNAP